MKILVCFDHGDLSQKLTSSARQYVDKYFTGRIDSIEFCFLNTAKQKLEKFLNKEENQDISVIFIPETNVKEINYAKSKNISVETYGFRDYNIKETGYGLKREYQLQQRFIEYIYGSFSSTVIQLNILDFSFQLLKKEELTPQLLNDQKYLFFNSKKELQEKIKSMEQDITKKIDDEIACLKIRLSDIEKKKSKCLNNIYLIKNM